MTLNPAAMERRPGFLRRMYDWTIGWAERPGGTYALFLLAFAESSFFPIPPIGFWGYDVIGEPIVRLYHGEAVMEKIEAWYDAYGFWGTLAAAVTPIPYKVFTIASGVFEFPFGPFMLASIIGRSFRFFLVGGTIYVFGPAVKAVIEKYFDWLAWLLLILGVCGFLAIKLLR